MPIRDEELVQFLLGETDAALRCRVEAALASDPQVAQRLQELRAALGLLDSLKSSVEPPEDLVSRTMQRIADAAEKEPIEDERVDREATDGHSVHSRRPSNSVPASAASMNSVSVRKLRSGGALWDSAILSVSIAALTCLLLPLVLQARYESRRAQCAYNLKTLGSNLTQMADMDHERRFPSVPTSGPEAFAGVFTIRLKDAGLLPTSAYLRCVSIPATDESGPRIICIPSSADFSMADEAQQAAWRAELGGNYAYSLGVLEEGRVVGPRLQGRTHFAILADAPMYDEDREVFQAHEGRGINIYYEDGHVGFVHLARALSPAVVPANVQPVEPAASKDPLFVAGSWSQSTDHPFRNIQGEHAAGLTPDDAALGPSYSTPRPALIRAEPFRPEPVRLR